MTTVGAGIVHYRFWPQVRPTLDALRDQTRPPEEIVLIENGSGDGSASAIRDAYPNIEVVEVTENRGPIGGMNLIFDTLLERGVDAILLLTHETVLERQALERMLARFEEDEAIGVVGPVLGFASRPDEVWSAGGTINPRSWLTDHAGYRSRLADWKGQPPHEVRWLEGACLLYRAEAVRQTGRLHEDFFMMFDEPDYQLRMATFGWRAECVPAAVAWQEPGDKPPYIFNRNRLGFLARQAPRRILLRELGRMGYDAVRDGISPRPGRGGRLHALAGALGVVDFVRKRWGRPTRTLTGRR